MLSRLNHCNQSEEVEVHHPDLIWENPLCLKITSAVNLYLQLDHGVNIIVQFMCIRFSVEWAGLVLKSS